VIKMEWDEQYQETVKEYSDLLVKTEIAKAELRRSNDEFPWWALFPIFLALALALS
jgi:hypothetical protein